jgi:predicted nucleotidyltransferase
MKKLYSDSTSLYTDSVICKSEELDINLLNDGIFKIAIKKVRSVAKKNGIVKSVLLRGSLSMGDFNKEFNDIDLSFILSRKNNIKDIIKIKSELSRFGNKNNIDISVSFIDKRQLLEDSRRGIHFHGRKSAVYSKEIENSVLIFGEDLRYLFGRCDNYNLLDIYRESCDLISHFQKDILMGNKKGLNFSSILAKKCLNCIGIFVESKCEVLNIFVKKISKKEGKKLKKIILLRKKDKLDVRDLEEIYSFLVFCRNFIFNQIGGEEYSNLAKRKW